MTEEQALLRDALARRLSTCDRHSAWDELGAAGVQGLIVAREHGGAGLGWAEAAEVFNVLGSQGLATPFLETSVIAPLLLAASSEASVHAVLRGIAERGERLAVCGLDPRLHSDLRARRSASGWHLEGLAPLVLDGESARAVVAVAAAGRVSAICLLDRSDARIVRAYPTIDGRRAADLAFDAAPALLVSLEATEHLEFVREVATACLAIEAAAVMARLVDDTADHLRQRKQFGQPLARFQVLQHRLVDMHIATRRAGSIARKAIAVIDAPRGERRRVVSAARVTIAQTGRFVGQQAVQLHGAMGMTEELPVGTMFKRLTVIADELGSADDALRAYAAPVS